MKRIALLPVAFAMGASFAALADDDRDTFTIDSRHTFPQYEVTHFGTSKQRGRFDKTEGKLVFDETAHKGSVEVTIDTASVSSGLAKLDEHLKGPDFFNVQQFPKMTFKSTEFVFDGNMPKKVNGNLTLLGVSRPVTLNVDFFHCGVNPMLLRTVCGADLSTHINRSEFGMKSLVGPVSDDVLLRINVEAINDKK
ncbi:MAG TPA: YceI family protein [Usitatibacter sp.]|nr:YceI family protein [Usitatibacter sp.]